MAKLHEECGVFGVYAPNAMDLAHTVYYGLCALQHRGQESCGIVVNNDGLFTSYKDLGLVQDVFSSQHLEALGEGSLAIGHVRYGTTGSTDRANAQPIVVNHIKGCMALAHNGNLTNVSELRSSLELEGSIFHTTSDTEVISYLITKERLTSGSIEEAINQAMNRIEGAYSLVIMSPQKLIAVRDERGFRPLCYGKAGDGAYVVASESCALDAVGARYVRELDPGEILIFDKAGVHAIRDHCNKNPRSLCVFEAVYFARPDSLIEGGSVHQARQRAGSFLAQEHPVEADLVIGVPDSGMDAAVGYSLESGIPYGIGLIKNKYIGRTFISPGQGAREEKVRIKLNPVRDAVAGKRIVLVDDSIVRGTTCRRIIDLLREAGATEVHLMVTAPPFINPCYYGTDIGSRKNLIACQHTKNEIAQIIGADSLGYLSVHNVRRICGDGLGEGFCTACFDGCYPTALPKDAGKTRFDRGISELGA